MRLKLAQGVRLGALGVWRNQVLPDAKAESKNTIRVVDKSGDDYLYLVKLFEKIQVAKLPEPP